MDAILVNPSSPEALNAAIKEATDKKIVVIAIDAPVTEPTAYNLSNDQENYGYLGAKWLFDQLNNKGNVMYMRGASGHPADTARDVGFKRALAEAGDGIKIANEVQTQWDQTTATGQMTTELTAGTPIDGVWTSGIDNVIVDAYKLNQVPFVPTVGADVGFVNQLLDSTNFPGLVGAAVTNPGSVGGAGVTLALQILNGQMPASHTVVLKPELVDNQSDAGKATLTS